ncbi:E3 SUMO-protein ligase NSE2-like [Drosophila mauritiana]|uniref:E3 SUMO-protein ligase NSE2 n=1 Tax=Drosophila mauritiana TaxID=7226 RepID=A0A6P8KRK6_DROMA|nr:E3 SUMO-protein ligase NSE2-like [Drosophila mauritiana]
MDFNHHADSALTTLSENHKFFKEMAEFVSDFNDGGEIQKLLDQNVELAEDLIRTKSKHQLLNKALKHAKNSSNTVEKFEEVWKERSAAVEQTRIDVKNSAEFKNFMKAVESAAPQEGAEINGQANGPAHDEDLIMEATGAEVFSLYDPWSKALIKNPVRNKICGHVYERDSVMLIIKDNIGIRCPVIGCANRSYIQPVHLVKDHDLQQKLQQRMSDAIEDESSSEDEGQADH